MRYYFHILYADVTVIDDEKVRISTALMTQKSRGTLRFRN